MTCHKCKKGTIRPCSEYRPEYPLAKCDNPECGYQALFASVQAAGTPIEAKVAEAKK